MRKFSITVSAQVQPGDARRGRDVQETGGGIRGKVKGMSQRRRNHRSATSTTDRRTPRSAPSLTSKSEACRFTYGDWVQF
jgi:hypothetical protein